MRRPNFFIIGGPKCGTTSLAAWLAGHERIFLSPKKEPHFFNDDTCHRRTITTLSQYEALYEGADERHLAVGEASTGYAFSKTAVPNILAYQPHARFIVCVRNPVEMAPSLHEQRVFAGEEPLRDFGAAWEAQFPERDPSTVPRGHFDPRVYAYGPFCKLGEQIERLFQLVPRDRVLIVFQQDLKADPGREYRRVLAHLGVPDDGRNSFPVLNSAKERRLLWVRAAAVRLRSLKHSLGISQQFGLLSAVEKWNRRERPRRPLDPALVARLKAYFAEDVQRLSELTLRDLSGWLA